MKITVPLYIISIILAIIGFPMVLVLVYLDLISTGITSKFFWTVAVVCCVLSILSFSLARILVEWAEEDEKEE